MRCRQFSLSKFSIKHRLALLIGVLLLNIAFPPTLGLFLGVERRLTDLTQQFASPSEQSALLLRKATIANGLAISATLQSLSSAARPVASAIRQQFTASQYTHCLYVRFCGLDPRLAFTNPDDPSLYFGSTPGDFTSGRPQTVKAGKSVGLVTVLINEPPQGLGGTKLQ